MMVEVVKINDWKTKALKKAKADASKGGFISHKKMGEWINSLGSENELSAPEVDVYKVGLLNIAQFNVGGDPC